MIGNVIFSSVKIEGCDGALVYILAPLAVVSFAQQKGVVALRVNQGLEMLNQSLPIVYITDSEQCYSDLLDNLELSKFLSDKVSTVGRNDSSF